MPEEVFGMKTLREWRLARLMSTQQLATRAGITKKTLIDLEHGRRTPHYATMGRLTEALGVEAGDVAEFAQALGELGKSAA